MKKALLIILVALCFFSGINAQTLLKGKVVSATDGTPISGVAIYLSGTSLGRISDLEGNYEIEYPDNINAPLIFRIMGYEKITVTEPLKANLSLVRMVEKADELETVYIANDDWSRAKKEKYFKQFFLGRTPAAEECKILNLDKVRLRFNPVTHILTASSNETIFVRNEILGYDIACDIGEFEIVFNPVDLKGISIQGNFKVPTHQPYSSYMQITTYFKEMEAKRPSLRRRLRNRKRLYEVSEMKLYRTMIAEQLKKEGYNLLYKRKSVDIDENIRVRALGDAFEVAFRHPKYIITDKANNQSILILMEQQKIVIDAFGNCLSPRAIQLGGFLGKLHLSGMLPLDYKPN